MDFTKLLNLAVDYMSEYFDVFIATLTQPKVQFQPLLKDSSDNAPLIFLSQENNSGSSMRLNPRLISFILISIFIGSTLNSLVPNRKAPPDLITIIVVLTSTWFFYSILTYWALRLSGGEGTLLHTLSISLQLFATLYVVSSFIAFIFGAVTNLPPAANYLKSVGQFTAYLVQNPIFSYYLALFCLLIIYLPVATNQAHKSGFIKRRFLLLLLTILYILGSISAFLASGAIGGG